MSKAAKDGNNFRREWYKEAFEKKAKERLDAELQLEEDREHKKTEAMPIVQRAPLQRRTEDLRLGTFVGTRQVVTGAQAIAGQMNGAYHCKVCDCVLRDSANYLLHINGRKHTRMLGMTMRAERSTVEEVRARLESHKADEYLKEMSADEKAEAYLQQFDARVKANEEQMRDDAREAHRRKREQRKQAGGPVGSAEAGPADETAEAAAAVATGGADEMAAMMGFDFGGFGGSKKNI